MTRKRKEPSHPRPPKRVKSSAIDQLVDRFVTAVNAGEPEHIIGTTYGDTPSVYVGEPDEYGWHAWEIKPHAGIDWVDALERRLPRRFPIAYRSLISRYIFPAFEAGPLWFFANTAEGVAYPELRTAIFSEDLAPVLQRSSYLQIGRPETGSYDAICFDPVRGDDYDRPLVQIDHESIIIDGIIEVVCDVAPSLQHLMQAVIEKAGLKPPE